MTLEDINQFAFIVGAPRCGTTTLAGFLKQHPDACAPFVKEPHFFAQHDLRGQSREEMRPLVEREFLDRFYGHCAGQAKKLAYDGSVSYLYMPEELAPALTLWPDAKFVIALRDPMTMIPSLHARLRVTGDENIEHFEQAWDAVPARARGKRIPWSTLEPRWLRYDEAGRFGTHVQKFFDTFGRERCFVSVFDDLVADPRAQYEKLCAFLGLTPYEGTDFSKQREASGVRIGFLQQLLKRPPKFTRNYLAGMHYRQRQVDLDTKADTDAVADKVFSVRKKVLRWNKVPYVKKPVPVRIQQQIRASLTGEIEQLGKLLDRDFSHWLQVRDDRMA